MVQVVRMFIQIAPQNRLFCGFVGVILLCTAGCRFPWPLVPEKVESSPPPAALKQYRQAVAAYHQRAYLEAADSFAAIRAKTSDERFALMALYGLACSKLMAAKTPKEYNEAMMLWLQWVDNTPEEFEYENPVMVNALLQEKMLFSNIPLTPDKTVEGSKDPMVSKWLLIKSKEELDRLRKELQAAKEELEKQKRTKKVQDKKIAELKRKIKALETIDQKIQKKKNAIPSAD